MKKIHKIKEKVFYFLIFIEYFNYNHKFILDLCTVFSFAIIFQSFQLQHFYRHILSGLQLKTENPCTYFKLVLLLRRLKFHLENPHQKAQVDALAAGVAIPQNLMSWLANHDMEDIGKAMKNNKRIIMKKKFKNEWLIRLREVDNDRCNNRLILVFFLI